MESVNLTLVVPPLCMPFPVVSSVAVVSTMRLVWDGLWIGWVVGLSRFGGGGLGSREILADLAASERKDMLSRWCFNGTAGAGHFLLQSFRVATERLLWRTR